MSRFLDQNIARPLDMTASAPDPGRLVHCTLIAVDYSATRGIARGDQAALHIRRHLMRMLGETLDSGGIPSDSPFIQDRGSSVLILLESGVVSPTSLVELLFDDLLRRLRQYNKMSSDTARLHLRLAETVGSVRVDEIGVASYAIDRLYLLLNAPDFLAKLTATPVELGLIIADHLYDDVSNSSEAFDPRMYEPVRVLAEEREILAWIRTPHAVIDSALPPMPSVSL